MGDAYIVRRGGSGGGKVCVLTVNNCGAGATVTATGIITVTATANYEGVAILNLTKSGAYTVSSSISKGTKTVTVSGQASEEIWLHLLPEAYQEVEYIEGTGTQFILTNSVPTNGHTYHMEYMTPSSWPQPYMCCFGQASGSDSNPCFKVWVRDNNTNRITWTIGSADVRPGVNTTSETIYSFDISLASGNNTGTVNGVSMSNNYSGSYSTYPFTLLAINSASRGVRSGRIRLWWAKTTGASTYAEYFVPCYRKSDNIVGMYDIVSNTFKTNAGSGSFTYGYNVYYPDELQFVSYLESTGPQYMTLRTYMGDSNTIEVNMAMTKNTWRGAIFGRNNSGGYENMLVCDFTEYRACFSPGDCKYAFTVNNFNKIKMCFKSGAQYFSVDNAVIGSSTSTRITNDYLVFPRYVTQSYVATDSAPCKFKEITIYDSSGKIRLHFLPAFCTSTNVAGMWETNTKTLYPNIGTGSWVVGPNI